MWGQHVNERDIGMKIILEKIQFQLYFGIAIVPIVTHEYFGHL
jgi:hypothetical protein